MWTEEHRARYRQTGERIPSDLTDAQWAQLELLIPDANSSAARGVFWVFLGSPQGLFVKRRSIGTPYRRSKGALTHF